MISGKISKIKALRNRTMNLAKEDIARLRKKLLTLDVPADLVDITNRTIHQDLFKVLEYLPENFVDLLFIDPPYNLTKEFNSNTFQEMSSDDYESWIDSWFKPLQKILKPSASVYICGDWKSSSAILIFR